MVNNREKNGRNVRFMDSECISGKKRHVISGWIETQSSYTSLFLSFSLSSGLTPPRVFPICIILSQCATLFPRRYKAKDWPRELSPYDIIKEDTV